MAVKGFISKKWERVYETIPEDGSIIRFKEIAKKLPGFSRTTISEALEVFCNMGHIQKEKKSKKNVEYSRIMAEAWSIKIPFHRKRLLNKKTNLDPQDYDIPISDVQRDAFIMGLGLLHTSFLKMLYDYAKEQNKEKRTSHLNKTLKFYYLPILETMITSLIDDVGLQDNVLEGLIELHLTQHFPDEKEKMQLRPGVEHILNKYIKMINF